MISCITHHTHTCVHIYKRVLTGGCDRRKGLGCTTTSRNGLRPRISWHETSQRDRARGRDLIEKIPSVPVCIYLSCVVPFAALTFFVAFYIKNLGKMRARCESICRPTAVEMHFRVYLFLSPSVSLSLSLVIDISMRLLHFFCCVIASLCDLPISGDVAEFRLSHKSLISVGVSCIFQPSYRIASSMNRARENVENDGDNQQG